MRRLLAILGLGLVVVIAAVAAVVANLTLRPEPRPPAVIAYEPDQLREVPPSTTVALVFNTAMDRGSVEQAFRVEPVVEGSFTWQGNRLIFQPKQPLQRNTTYSITLERTARSSADLTLAEPFQATFTTAGDLMVVAFYPTADASEVPVESPVTVAFNRPVVALQPDNPTLTPLTLAPSAAGRGQWLSPSLYRFQPEGGLRPATVYTVTLGRDFQDLTGGQLASAVTFSFATIRPALREFTPTADSRYVLPTQEVVLVFNQPMDRESVQAAFSLTPPDGPPTSGTFRWESDQRVVFVPAQPLQPEVTYTAQLAAGLRGTQGPLPSRAPFRWQFQTVGPPRLVTASPTGGAPVRLDSTVALVFNQPMDPNSVAAALTILPEPTQVFSSWVQSNTQLNLFFSLQPSTNYVITVGAEARDRSGRPLGTPQRVTFTTAPRPPQLSFARILGQNSITVLAGTPVLAALEAVNVPSARLQLRRLDRQSFVHLDATFRKESEAPLGEPVAEWMLSTAAPLNATRLITQPLTVNGQLLPAGYYQLTVEGAGARDQQLVVVSQRALTLKLGPGSGFLWAVDPLSGQPVADASVMASYASGQPVTLTQVVRTRADGTAEFAIPPGGDEPFPRLWVFLDEPAGPSVVSSSWSDGIEPWQFGLETVFTVQPFRGQIDTDRPIYRAGQLVFFKGILRRDDDGLLSLPSGLSSLPVSIRDPSGRLVYSQTLPLDRFGSFNGQFQLAENAPTGSWAILAGSGKNGEPTLMADFQVAEYRRPEFEVTVTPGQREVIAGQTITASVAAEYFFGAPVAGAELLWRVRAEPYRFRGPQGADWSRFTYGVIDLRPPPFGGRLAPTASGTGRLDGNGRLVIQFPADLGGAEESQLFTLEGSVTDSTGQQISGRSEVVVHRGAFYLGLRPTSFLVRQGESASWEIASVNPDTSIRPNVPVALDFATRRYYSVQERQPDGSLVWVTRFEDTPVPNGSQTLTTEANGRARASFTPPRSGLYRLQATTRDELGNEVKTVSFLWVVGTDYVNWGLESNDRMDLVLDKAQYAVGETAKVLATSPFTSSLALLTVERNRVRSHQVLPLSGNSAVLEVPVTPEFLPNVFVSVVVFAPSGPAGPASYKLGYARLSVDTSARQLRVNLTADRATYRPGETVRYRVRVTDASGQPVQAQLSAAVVDLAVLSLAEEESPTSLFDAFYRQRGLGVRTAATLAASQSRLDLASRAAGKGGGGPSTEVRSRFADTAYWNPAILTSDAGEATFTVTLPDNLTTWRLTVKAQTEDSRFGQARYDVLSTKDLLVRPQLPRFLTSGDDVWLTAVVQNRTERPVEVTAALETRNLVPAGGSFSPQRLTVPAGGAAPVRWLARASQPGEARVLFRAETSGTPPPDAVEIALPVRPLTTPEVVASAGQVAAEQVEEVRLSGTVDRDQGELTVDLTPSLTAGLATGLRELESFPWEPVEVTVSRLVVRLQYAHVLSATGIVSPVLTSQLRDDTAATLQKLYRAQQPDGGWGWFPTDASQPFLSAYVVQGMLDVQRAGLPVDTTSLNRGLGFLTQYLERPVDVGSPDDVNTRAFMLLVLAEAGRPNTGLASALFERRAALSDYGRGYLLHAFTLASGGRLDSRAQTLLTELATHASWSATGAHWSEPAPSFRTFGGPSRSTAVVLAALLAADPTSPLIDPAVRWLMAERRSGWWSTSYATAVALRALANYAALQTDRTADYRYRVVLNGKTLAEGAVTPGALGGRTLVVPVRELLLDAPNRLVLQRDANGPSASTGRLYYTSTLRYFRPGYRVEPRSEGIAISREYFPVEGNTPLQEGAVGQLVRVRLTLVAPSDLDYLVVEDPLFAGAEAVDPNLATTSIFDRVTNRRQWRFSHIDIRDDRVALFATTFPRGSYEFSYLIRLTSPGQFLAPPARASLMYFPEVWGRSGSSTFRVKE
ncbi:MAG: hypothetical protein KatS3mg061_2503 [Dehalococcoidia bacterium]|nr:MAG: hypothetical protein KatS3mg061_2503 [Dehalococcoidia bacterium]